MLTPNRAEHPPIEAPANPPRTRTSTGAVFPFEICTVIDGWRYHESTARKRGSPLCLGVSELRLTQELFGLPSGQFAMHHISVNTVSYMCYLSTIVVRLTETQTVFNDLESLRRMGRPATNVVARSNKGTRRLSNLHDTGTTSHQDARLSRAIWTISRPSAASDIATPVDRVVSRPSTVR